MHRAQRISLSLSLLAALAAAGTGCSKISDMMGGGEKTQDAQAGSAAAAGSAAVVAPAPAPLPPALPMGGTEEEKQRFISAAAETSCAAARDPGKAVEAANAAMQKFGFDQMSYGQASGRYLTDPAVAQAIATRRTECMAAVPPPATPGTAAGTAAGSAAAAPTKPEGDKTAEPAKEEKKASPLAGRWSGNFNGSHSARLIFTVGADGRTIKGGEIRGTSNNFSGDFSGMISGDAVVLSARSQGQVSIMLNGSVSGRQMTGSWRGTIMGKNAKGTWSVSRN